MEQYLSLELVSNILSRLPVKELLRCKCVCKSWLDLITDPCFITNHHVVYNNNLTRHKERLLVTRSIHKYSRGEKTQISILSWDPKGLVVSSEVLTPSYGYDSHQRLAPHIMGPCNGIYYLSEGVGNPNIMTNFSLRQCRVLPKSHLTPPHKTYISCFNCVGFGFDPKTNDYKVVVAKDLWLKNVQMEFWWVEFYSLNSNSWRKSDNSLNMSLPFSATSCGSVYTYVRNCCHWGFRGTVDDVVISFDMVNEAFRIIRAPSLSDSYSSKQAHQTLAPFDESSTIGVIVNIPLVGRLDVWVMRDYWDDGSWVEQYSVGPVEVIAPLGFCGSNRFLWEDYNERLVLYELDGECGHTRDLQVRKEPHHDISAARYMESHVSLHVHSGAPEHVSEEQWHKVPVLEEKKMGECTCTIM